MLGSIDKLGEFPIIQIAVAFLVVVGGLLAIRRGEKEPRAEEQLIPEQRWYFDGPVNAVINELKGIYRVLNEIRDEAKDVNLERRAEHKEHMDAVRDLTERLPSRRR